MFWTIVLALIFVSCVLPILVVLAVIVVALIYNVIKGVIDSL